MSVRHNYDAANLKYNKDRVEALEKALDREKTRSSRFKKVGKGLYSKIENLKKRLNKYEQRQNT